MQKTTKNSIQRKKSLRYQSFYKTLALAILFLIPQIVFAQNAETHFNRGNEHIRNNDFSSAIREYTEAIRLNPNHQAARDNLYKAMQVSEM